MVIFRKWLLLAANSVNFMLPEPRVTSHVQRGPFLVLFHSDRLVTLPRAHCHAIRAQFQFTVSLCRMLQQNSRLQWTLSGKEFESLFFSSRNIPTGGEKILVSLWEMLAEGKHAIPSLTLIAARSFRLTTCSVGQLDKRSTRRGVWIPAVWATVKNSSVALLTVAQCLC